jgi:hypothetical protein
VRDNNYSDKLTHICMYLMYISAGGAMIGAEAQYRDVAGADYRKRPEVRPRDKKCLTDIFESTHGFRWRVVS